jgi:hypothetical protein
MGERSLSKRKLQLCGTVKRERNGREKRSHSVASAPLVNVVREGLFHFLFTSSSFSPFNLRGS